jgi:lipopolysaccharide/colanic/teichoic acid biosynthesis glycosyltransferase
MAKKVSILYIGDSADVISALSEHPQIALSHEREFEAAVNRLKSGNPPDVILCDLNFANGNGFEMHTFLRNDRTYQWDFKNIPFILLYQKFEEDVFKKAFTTRMDDFFVLPLPNIESLLSRISYLMDYRKMGVQLPVYRMPFIKRLFDIVVASTALLLLSPILLIVLIAIRLESKGKVYYISKRMGQGLEPFDFYKLRSMRTGADKELSNLAKDNNQYKAAVKTADIDFTKPCPECAKRTDGKPCSPIRFIGSHEICDHWYAEQKSQADKSKSTFVKISKDPRVTRVGKIIRNTSIDELPQLINVIKGDMSIVGNRPLPVYEGNKLTSGEMAKRMLAPAGITGLWQVKLRGQGGDMSEAERKHLDNDYYEKIVGNNYSFFYDLGLVLLTVRALFQKDSV